MRKYLFLLAIAMMIFTYLPAQTSQMLLKRLAEIVKQNNSDEALHLFRQLKAASLEQAMAFCLQQAQTGGNLQRALETEVIDTYKLRCDYADAYAFCRKLLDNRPNDIELICDCAELQFLGGHNLEAVALYERVVNMDETHIEANIFLGGYHFLQGEKARRNLAADYLKLTSPTRMQQAAYRNEYILILSTSYTKAKFYLRQALRTSSSVEVMKILEKIEAAEKKIRK